MIFSTGKKYLIGLKIHSFNANLASYRIRTLIPFLGLKKRGYKLKFIDNFSDLNDVNLLIIFKGVSAEDLYICNDAFKRGIPIIYDLSDNIFVDNYYEHRPLTPLNVFQSIEKYLSALIVPTEQLAIEVNKKKQNLDLPVYVIPDSYENVKTIFQCYVFTWYSNAYNFFSNERFRRKLTTLFFKTLKSGVNLDLRRKKTPKMGPAKIKKSKNKKIILWFGNSGGGHSKYGISDLLLIRRELEDVASVYDIELIVISNSYGQYESLIKPFAVQSRYIEWKLWSILYYIKMADVVVVPNSMEAFSLCKSPNRALMSIMAGTPAIVTRTPAYRAINGFGLFFDNFKENLEKIIAGDVSSREVVKLQSYIYDNYGSDVAANKWCELVERYAKWASNSNKYQVEPYIAVSIQLPQDIALAECIMREFYTLNIKYEIWINKKSYNQWPQIRKWVEANGIKWVLIPVDMSMFNVSFFGDALKGLLCITETSLRPHYANHTLVNLANAAGIPTFTMQHGFENVGLTYSDETHRADQIQIDSKYIYVWSDLDALVSNASTEIKHRCIPVGYPKHINTADIPVLKDTFMVGIFENLHWHRYDDQYRKLFINNVRDIVDAYPNIDFVFKTHDAGRWITKGSNSAAISAENFHILDEKSELYEIFSSTTQQYLNYLAAVITTPSTIAVDAAMRGIPTAVIGGDSLDLEKYSPLTNLIDIEGWKNFIEGLLDHRDCSRLQNLSQDFCRKNFTIKSGAKNIAQSIQSKTL